MKKTDIILLTTSSIISIAIMEIIVHLIGIRVSHGSIILGTIIGVLLSINRTNRQK